LASERVWAPYVRRKDGRRALAAYQDAEGRNHRPTPWHPEWLSTRDEALDLAEQVAVERKLRRQERGAALIVGAELSDGHRLGALNITYAYELDNTLREEAVNALLALDSAAEDCGDVTIYFKYAASEQARLAAIPPRRPPQPPDDTAWHPPRKVNWNASHGPHFESMVDTGVIWWCTGKRLIAPEELTELRTITATTLAAAVGAEIPADIEEEPEPVATAPQLPLFPDMPAVAPPATRAKSRGGRAPRSKGDRVERGIVAQHLDIGVFAERVPLSGAARYQGNGTDIDVYALGRDAAPLRAEVKARKDGQGFATLERWLGNADALFLRRDRADPVVVLPWATWSRLLKGAAGSIEAAVGAEAAPAVPEEPDPALVVEAAAQAIYKAGPRGERTPPWNCASPEARQFVLAQAEAAVAAIAGFAGPTATDPAA
jgi:hypothetical protein